MRSRWVLPLFCLCASFQAAGAERPDVAGGLIVCIGAEALERLSGDWARPVQRSVVWRPPKWVLPCFFRPDCDPAP